MLDNVKLKIDVFLGTTTMSLIKLSEIEIGKVISLNTSPGDFSKVYINNEYIGSGSIDVNEKNLAITILNYEKSKYLKNEKTVLKNDLEESLNKNYNEPFFNSKIVNINEFNNYEYNNYLDDIDSKIIADLLLKEQKSIITIILSLLKEDKIIEVLKYFNKETQKDIIEKLFNIKNINKTIVKRIIFMFEKNIKNYLNEVEIIENNIVKLNNIKNIILKDQ